MLKAVTGRSASMIVDDVAGVTSVSHGDAASCRRKVVYAWMSTVLPVIQARTIGTPTESTAPPAAVAPGQPGRHGRRRGGGLRGGPDRARLDHGEYGGHPGVYDLPAAARRVAVAHGRDAGDVVHDHRGRSAGDGLQHRRALPGRGLRVHPHRPLHAAGQVTPWPCSPRTGRAR